MVPAWLETSSAEPAVGQVLSAADLDPEPGLHQRPEQRQEDLGGELRVEAELVDGIVAASSVTGRRRPSPPPTPASRHRACRPAPARPWQRVGGELRAAADGGRRQPLHEPCCDPVLPARPQRVRATGVGGRSSVPASSCRTRARAGPSTSPAGRRRSVGLGRGLVRPARAAAPDPGRTLRAASAARPRAAAEGLVRLPRPGLPRLPSWMISASATARLRPAEPSAPAQQSAGARRRPAPGVTSPGWRHGRELLQRRPARCTPG